MILPLLLLSLGLATSARPQSGQRSARSACSGKRLMASGGGGDGLAPPLSQTELDTSLPLTQAELAECYGVAPADTEDQGKEEGDMVRNYTASAASVPEGVALSGLSSVSRLWPGGRIPYELSGAFGPGARQAIAAAIGQLHDATCLRLVAREADDTNYIRIQAEDGCWSYVGRTGEGQTVSLGTGCVYNGIILHELLHAAGFVHEHSRPDRGSFSGMFENIQDGKASQFDKYDEHRIAELNVGYDYGSIMHYRPNSFSKNGEPTIEALLDGGQEQMGQRDGLSAMDIRKINKLYNCPEPSTATTATTKTNTSAPLTTTTTAAPTTTEPVTNCRDKISGCVFDEIDCGTKKYPKNCRRTCGLC